MKTLLLRIYALISAAGMVFTLLNGCKKEITLRIKASKIVSALLFLFVVGSCHLLFLFVLSSCHRELPSCGEIVAKNDSTILVKYTKRYEGGFTKSIYKEIKPVGGSNIQDIRIHGTWCDVIQ
jgi:hypothetical protein